MLIFVTLLIIASSLQIYSLLKLIINMINNTAQLFYLVSTTKRISVYYVFRACYSSGNLKLLLRISHPILPNDSTQLSMLPHLTLYNKLKVAFGTRFSNRI